jgi:hypothetical protein
MYTPEKDNSQADALSRQSDIAGTKKITNLAILKINANRLLGPARQLNQLIISIRIKVPEELQESIIRQHYDNPVHRHPRVA